MTVSLSTAPAINYVADSASAGIKLYRFSHSVTAADILAGTNTVTLTGITTVTKIHMAIVQYNNSTYIYDVSPAITLNLLDNPNIITPGATYTAVFTLAMNSLEGDKEYVVILYG